MDWNSQYCYDINSLNWSIDSTNTNKNSGGYFLEIEKQILKSVRKYKGYETSKTILKIRNKDVGFIIPDFKT